MDRISKSLLDDFSKDVGIEGLPEETRSEHFSAFVAMSRLTSDELDATEIVTGAGSDTGIDAIAIAVNGALASDKQRARFAFRWTVLAWLFSGRPFAAQSNVPAIVATTGRE